MRPNGEGDQVSIRRDAPERKNAGAGYCVDGDGDCAIHAPTFAIDNWYWGDALECCDLICLDIEGDEYSALVSAFMVFMNHRPPIVIEEKPLAHISDHTKPRRYLEAFGYHERERIHRDVIFTHD
jgi:hypothetical protein